MTRRRLGSGVRAMWLVAGLGAAMALSGTAFAGKPVPDANVTLEFSGCTATISYEWQNLPGRLRNYQVVLTNNVNGTMYIVPRTAARSGTDTSQMTLGSGASKTFTARLWFQDHAGVTVLGFSSDPIDAACD